MQGFEDGCGLLVFAHSHQDLGSTVLYLLELLNTLARDEKCIAAVHSGGGKGVDCIREGGGYGGL